MHSKDISESELSVFYRNNVLANVKSFCALWNLAEENNVENTLW
jgi:hypothetical protein